MSSWSFLIVGCCADFFLFQQAFQRARRAANDPDPVALFGLRIANLSFDCCPSFIDHEPILIHLTKNVICSIVSISSATVVHYPIRSHETQLQDNYTSSSSNEYGGFMN